MRRARNPAPTLAAVFAAAVTLGVFSAASPAIPGDPASADPAVRLVGFATHEPIVKAIEGTVGEVRFAPQTGRFTALVSPAPVELREGPGNDSVRRAVVSFGR